MCVEDRYGAVGINSGTRVIRRFDCPSIAAANGTGAHADAALGVLLLAGFGITKGAYLVRLRRRGRERPTRFNPLGAAAAAAKLLPVLQAR